MTDSPLLAGAWKARNAIYEELFGNFACCLPKNYSLPDQPDPSFTQTTTAAGTEERVFQSDMRAQKISVLAYAPTDARPHWIYVTSGLSNPWFQEAPDEVSGFGCELMVKSPVEAKWPFKLLRRLAYFILSYSGTLSPGVILNMKSPIGLNAGELNNIFVWYGDEAPDCLYMLPSGAFGLFCVVGITEGESVLAESIGEYGTWCIQQLLRQSDFGQLTDPNRACITKNENINDMVASVKNYADNFRPVS